MGHFLLGLAVRLWEAAIESRSEDHQQPPEQTGTRCAHMSYFSPHLPLWRQLRDARRTDPSDVLQACGVHAPPVDVDAIARRLGTIVHYVESPGWSGAVSSSDVRAEIWINQDESRVRQRFTLAHEIGHLLLHPLQVAYRDTSFTNVTNPNERQANQFAAELLMPAWMMRTALNSTGGYLWRMARLFDVSEQAMEFRLKNLGLL